MTASASLSRLAFLALPCVLPYVAAAGWGTLAVPGDPSRSGDAPVPVPGWLRLAIELLVFGSGALAFAALQRWLWFGIFLTAFVLHHAFTISCIRWLLRQ